MAVLFIMVNKCSALYCKSGYSGETKDPNITDIRTTDLLLTELQLVSCWNVLSFRYSIFLCR